MSVKMISSSSNPKVKHVIQLIKKAKVRKEETLFVVEGMKMVNEARQYGIKQIFVSETFYNDNNFSNLQRLNEVPYEVVTDKIFAEMSDTVTPQGILAIVEMPKYCLEDILAQKNKHLIILESLRDPGNLGTIIRSAEGAGVTGVIMNKECVDLFNSKVIRSTMGSIFRVPFCYVEDLKEVLLQMKEENISLYAAHLAGTSNYEENDFTKDTGILIGNEANGLSDSIAECASNLVKIPMAGEVESLNAAIAAAILMYEVARQRRI